LVKVVQPRWLVKLVTLMEWVKPVQLMCFVKVPCLMKPVWAASVRLGRAA